MADTEYHEHTLDTVTGWTVGWIYATGSPTKFVQHIVKYLKVGLPLPFRPHCYGTLVLYTLLKDNTGIISPSVVHETP